MDELLDRYLTPTVRQRLEQAGVHSKEQLIQIIQANDAGDRLACLRGIGGQLVRDVATYAYLDGYITEEKRKAIWDKTDIHHRRRYE